MQRVKIKLILNDGLRMRRNNINNLMLVNAEHGIARLYYDIRLQLVDVLPEDAIFIMINGLMPAMNKKIIELYDAYSKEGILSISVFKENAFG